jgi:hypothetical protein
MMFGPLNAGSVVPFGSEIGNGITEGCDGLSPLLPLKQLERDVTRMNAQRSLLNLFKRDTSRDQRRIVGAAT